LRGNRLLKNEIAIKILYLLFLSERPPAPPRSVIFSFPFLPLRLPHPLVEREALVQAFSPGSTLEPGLKVFRRRGPKCSLETPLLVPVGITNRDKRAASQRHFPAMIDAGF
jgi:hypothetical protein